MLLRPLLATFVLGCAIGVGATLLGSRRESSKAIEPAAVKPRELAPSVDREIAPSMVGEMPDDLTLQEIYERVSFFS